MNPRHDAVTDDENDTCISNAFAMAGLNTTGDGCVNTEIAAPRTIVPDTSMVPADGTQAVTSMCIGVDATLASADDVTRVVPPSTTRYVDVPTPLTWEHASTARMPVFAASVFAGMVKLPVPAAYRDTNVAPDTDASAVA